MEAYQHQHPKESQGDLSHHGDVNASGAHRIPGDSFGGFQGHLTDPYAERAQARPHEGFYGNPPQANASFDRQPHRGFADPLPQHSYGDSYAPSPVRKAYGNAFAAPLPHHTYDEGYAARDAYGNTYAAPTTSYEPRHPSHFVSGGSALAPQVLSQTTVSVTPRPDLATWTYGESYGPAGYGAGGYGASAYGTPQAYGASLSRSYNGAGAGAGYAAGSAPFGNAASLTNAAFMEGAPVGGALTYPLAPQGFAPFP